MSPAADEDLLARQSALQQEAREVLAGLDLAALVAGTGSLLITGSFVSGLMCWPEVDVMVHVSASGSVTGASIAKSSGDRVLDAASIAAASNSSISVRPGTDNPFASINLLKFSASSLGNAVGGTIAV